MNKKNIFKISLIVIISVFMIVCTTNSFAQEKRGPTNIIQFLDKDNDGRVSKKEEYGCLHYPFNLMDRNKNGYIDKSEADPIYYSAAQFIIMFDNDMNGKVSQKEVSHMPMGMPQNFNNFDSNGDGYIGLTEISPCCGPGNFRTFYNFKQAYDVDRDGKVSKYELSGFPGALLEGRLFTNADKNKDGYIVESEYAKRPGKGGKKGRAE